MKRHNSAGYTILEVMIVLSVTSALFIGAAILLTGKQAQTETTQSIRDFESKIQSITSDVANGYFPSINCVAPASGPVSFPAGTNNAGSNGGCIFLGEILNIHSQKADIIPVVGRQYSSGNVDSATVAEAMPVKTSELFTGYDYKYGLTLTKVASIVGNTEYMALAFISELGSTSSSNPVTGSRSTLLYGIAGSAASNTSTAASLVVNSDGSNLVPLPGGAYICVQGYNEKKGKITIGASGSQTTTNVLIDSGVGNEC